MNIIRTFTMLMIALAFTAGIVFAKYLDSSGQSRRAADSLAHEGASYTGYRHKSSGAEPVKEARASALPQSLKEGKTHTVNEGDTIMAAVQAAKPGDTIKIFPGTYHETVYIDKDDIRLIGVIEEGERATLDGKALLNDAILYSGNNILVENLKITRYKGNGIMGQAGNNFEIRNNIIVDTGVYGIFPQLGKNGIVEHNVISGIEDAAIYVGMSDNIHVAHNEVFDSVAGIEIEN